jgi:cysteine desulfurase / selenocysteine lyase
MSPDDPTGVSPSVGLPAGGDVVASLGDPFASLTSEVARLANELFKQGPIGAPHQAPSAFNVGGGGLSGSAPSHPPTPGFLQQPPIASAPLPKESDLRTIPAAFSSVTGLEPLVVARTPDGAGATPYFLESAGALHLPSASPGFDVAPPTSAPSAPTAAPVPGAPFASSVPSAPVAPSAPGGPSSPGASPAPTGSGIQTRNLELFEVRPELAPKLGGSSDRRGVFDAASIKKDFPILSERVHGQPLVWLDNAATTQKPQAVIDRLAYFYAHENSNVHRAAHALAARATDAYEGAREKVRRFINAPSKEEIVFARGATEAINLVAKSWGHRNVKAGDEILITWLEHHANIVPWQQLCAEKGARLCVAPVDSTGQVILDEFEKLLGPRTRLVSITQVSNALGTITPAREMVQMAHRHGALALVDGAQAVSHMPVDVQALDCDFYCFSGHKVFAPTGIGALFGKADVLAAMPPWQGGGNMIREVTFEKTTYQAPPWKFEAGTGNIADAVGLGAAIDYVSALGLVNIERYEHELLVYATERLLRVPGLKLIGTAAEKAGVLSFVLDGVRTEDVGEILDREGIAVRSGHHCAQPILRRFGLDATVRASLAPYNTVDDIDALCAALLRLQTGQSLRGRA